MSRSNPNAGIGLPNPANRLYEWNGEQGHPRYYDRAAKERVDLQLPFTFITLDRTATICGWHERSKSNIWSNEVRDTTKEPFVVRCKAGQLAQGFYREIKGTIAALDAYYAAKIYIGYKPDKDKLAIGSFTIKGAALNAWVEFEKEHREDIYKQAVRIASYAEGKKGRIVFRTPVFSIATLQPETDAQAKALDQELQHYLDVYFKRNTKEQVAAPADTDSQASADYDGPTDTEPPADYAPEADDEPPF